MKRSSLRSGAFALLAFTSAITLTSCSEFQANKSIEKAQRILTELETDLNGNVHASSDLENIRARIQEANQQLGSGNASAARTTAKSAVSIATQARIAIVRAEAEARYNRANEEIRVGDLNKASQFDPQRYQRITQLRDKMNEQRGKDAHEDVIRTAQQVIDEMTTLLSPLDSQTRRARITAEDKLNTLKLEGGLEYVPEKVIEVQDNINRATKFYEDDRDYENARLVYEDATTAAEAGIESAKEARSQERIREIEELLATALLEGAKEYMPQEYERVTALNGRLLQDFSDRLYDRVLEGSPTIRDQARTLVVSTKRAAADARINTVDTNIRDLVEGGVREYLPGRIDELEALAASAKDIRRADDEPAFDRIKLIAVEATTVFEKIMTAFSELAVDSIRRAGNSLDVTEGVYNQLGNIFDPIVGTMSPEQQAFENQKAARQTQLGQDIANNKRALQDAFLKQSNNRFRAAILDAEEIKRNAERILDSIHHVVGHNAAIELANLISRYERDGAREYAPDELVRSTADLEAVKAGIARQAYRESVERAAEARANVELMAQRIAGRATVNIRDAREALRRAGSERTRKYRPEMLDDVLRLINEAEVDLREERLKIAVEKADAATNLARQAQTEAWRQSSTESIERTKAAIQRSQLAGAELYAGRELQDAKSLLASAESLFLGEDYEKAEDLSNSAGQRAEQALYKKINDAETALAGAKAVGGWEHRSSDLGSAGAKIRSARQELEAGNYTLSHGLADSARSEANGAARSSKNNNYHVTVARIKANLDQGTSQGINFFQPEESIAIRTRLTELENEYNLGKYDLVMTELAKLESDLRATLDSTAQTVAAVANQQERRLDALVAEGAVIHSDDVVKEARANLRFARLDYRRGLYKSAHSSLDTAITLINELALRESKEAYGSRVTAMLARHRDLQAQFSSVLGLNAEHVKGLIKSSDGAKALSISARIRPDELREGMDELYREALAISVPKGYGQSHESLVDALNQARLSAGIFERLSALPSDSTAQGSQLVDEAFRLMHRSNELTSVVERQLADERFRNREGSSQIGLLGRR